MRSRGWGGGGYIRIWSNMPTGLLASSSTVHWDLLGGWCWPVGVNKSPFIVIFTSRVKHIYLLSAITRRPQKHPGGGKQHKP